MATTLPARKGSPTNPAPVGQESKYVRLSDINGLLDHTSGWVNVKSYGATGDGTTDDTTAFEAWVAAMPATGARMLIPPGTYIITPGSFLTLSGKTDFRIDGYGATLKAANGSSHVVGKHMLFLSTCTNGVVSGITFDGNRANRTPAEVLAYQVLIGSSNSKTTLRDVKSINSCIDGFYIGSPGVSANYSSDVTLDNCEASNAYRNALSIITGVRVSVLGGSYHGSTGTAPQQGLDIEPDSDDQAVQDILIRGAAFYGNVGAGIQVMLRSAPTAIQRRITLDHCSSTGNTGVGLSLLYPNVVIINQCDISLNSSFGVDWETGGKDVTFSQTTIRKNAGRGMALSPGNGFGTASRTTFIGTSFLDNGTSSPGTQHGIRMAPAGTGAVDDVQFIGCVFSNVDGSNQASGLTTGSTAVTKLKIVGSTFGSSTGAAVVLSDDAASRVLYGNIGIGVVQRATNSISSDRGDTSQTLTSGTDEPVQRWATTLGAARTVTLSTTGAARGDTFRVVRTGLGAFTLDVGGLKTIPSATAAFVDVTYDGSAWRLTGYGLL